MKLKNFLAQAITSKEQYDTLLVEASPRNTDYIGRPTDKDAGLCEKQYDTRSYVWFDDGDRRVDTVYREVSTADFCLVNPNGGTGYKLHHTRWYLHREFMRTNLGLYVLSDPMRNLVSRFPEIGIHCKPGFKDDPLAVFYTHDLIGGTRDQQVMTSLGKLMRRLYPHADDAVIRDIEAQHRADMTNELELLPSYQIVNAYIGCAAGSCMTHPASHWKLEGGLHPTAVYDAPGFAMAVSRDSAGVINARSLVWINPENPEDKRFVRVYGDTALTRRLTRNGFRLAGLAGARIKKIQIRFGLGNELGDDCYVMPYVDVKDQPEHVATYVAHDGEWLKLLNRQEADALYRHTGRANADAQCTGGYKQIPAGLDIKFLNKNCPVTGKKIGFTDPTHLAFIDGQRTCVSTAGRDQLVSNGYMLLRTVDGGRTTDVLMPVDTPSFIHAYRSYVESDDIRASLGYVRLDRTLYPDADWVRNGDEYEWAHRTIGMDGDAVMVKSEDTFDYVSGHTRNRIHTSGLPKGLVKISPITAGTPAWASTDTEVVTTRSGRKVVPGVHAVRQDIEGVWDFERNLKKFRLRGTYVYIPAARQVGWMSHYADKITEILYESIYSPASLANDVITDRECGELGSKQVMIRTFKERAVANAGYVLDWYFSVVSSFVNTTPGHSTYMRAYAGGGGSERVRVFDGAVAFEAALKADPEGVTRDFIDGSISLTARHLVALQTRYIAACLESLALVEAHPEPATEDQFAIAA